MIEKAVFRARQPEIAENCYRFSFLFVLAIFNIEFSYFFAAINTDLLLLLFTVKI